MTRGEGQTVTLEFDSAEPVAAGEIFYVDHDIPLPAAEARQLGARGAMTVTRGQYRLSAGGRSIRVALRVRGEWASTSTPESPPPVLAATHDFDGVRAEARIGYETPTVSGGGNVVAIGSAVSFGAEIGYDFSLGRSVVAGPYAVYEFSRVDLCNAFSGCLSEDGTFGAGGRIGLVVSPHVLVYGKLGYARIRFSARSQGLTESESDGGVQAAIGLNVNFSRHLYGLAEIDYADFGRFGGVNLQRRHVAAGIGARF